MHRILQHKAIGEMVTEIVGLRKQEFNGYLGIVKVQRISKILNVNNLKKTSVHPDSIIAQFTVNSPILSVGPMTTHLKSPEQDHSTLLSRRSPQHPGIRCRRIIIPVITKRSHREGLSSDRSLVQFFNIGTGSSRSQ